MTGLRAAALVAAIWFLVATPVVGFMLVRAVHCAYITNGYGHADEYAACVR